jgi:hypothetical protein
MEMAEPNVYREWLESASTQAIKSLERRVAALEQGWPSPATPNPPGPTPSNSTPFWECPRCKMKFSFGHSDNRRVEWDQIPIVADFHDRNHQSPPPASD